MKYCLIANLLFTTLQVFGYAQIFTLVTEHHTHNNMVTGFMGNGTVMSGIFAMLSPVFMYQTKRQDILSLILMTLLLYYCGTTVGDPSISGYIILPLLLIYCKREKNWIWYTLAGCVFIGMLLLPYIPKLFFYPQGRFALWEAYLPHFKAKALSGVGLGGMSSLHKEIYMPQPGMIVKQMHFEYYQFAFEIGIIGLVLILNIIWYFIRDRSKNELSRILKAIVYGFLLNGLFNFPAHLWIPSVWAIFAYAGYRRTEC
jgi:hypothetical protein